MDPKIIVIVVVLTLVGLYEVLRHYRGQGRKRLAPSAAPQEVRPGRAVPEQSPELAAAQRRQQSDRYSTDLRSRLSSASTAEEALDIFADCPIDSEEEGEAAHRAHSLLAKEVEDASSIDACIEVSRIINDGKLDDDETEAAARNAGRKALGMIASFRDAIRLLDGLSDNRVDDEGLYALIVKEALARADFSGCIELRDDLNENYGEAFEGHERAALERALELAQSEEDCGEILDRLGYDDSLEDTVRIKRVAFLTDVESCQEVWDDAGTDSHVGEVAICRAADIIRKRAATLVESDTEPESAA